MVQLNKFKLINQKSEIYFQFLEKELNKKIKVSKESNIARFGFYLLVLEAITNIKDITTLHEMITDTEFNKEVLKINFKDHGVDAISIDEEKKIINIFNFKYRDNYDLDSKLSENDLKNTLDYFQSIMQKQIKHFEGKFFNLSKKVSEKVHSKEPWSVNFYMVSNEEKSLDENNPIVQRIKTQFGSEVISITLNKINSFMSFRPSPINSSLLLDKDSILSFSEDSLSSAKSYIIKLSLVELIRITSNDISLRKKIDLDDLSLLSKVDIDFDILFDNVRGFLGETKFNSNISKTLKEEPTKFFIYNNGITITAKNIEVDPYNVVGKYLKIDLTDIQVVNGGQTLRTIHDFNKQDNLKISDYLSKAEILIRIFKTNKEEKLTSKIAEYTNSQNSISPIDLKSISYEQIQIEKFLENENILYLRKSGNIGRSLDAIYEHRIDMEKFAQILFAKNGFPEKASNQKTKIFEKYYDDTFRNENFRIEDSANIIKEYYLIKEKYEKKSNLKVTDQKIFFILYLNMHLDKDINEIIDILENEITGYKKDEDLAFSRKLIQRDFKEQIDKIIKKNTNSNTIETP